ncbi:MAG: transposase [Gammaproteobacteria bacterium]
MYPNATGIYTLPTPLSEAAFSGGEITSDGGVLLLSELDRQLGLTVALDRVLRDPRCPG